MALRKMRDYRSMSVRDVGDLLNVSFTTVSHMENGRATIHEEYLKNFLKSLKFSMKDFKKFCEGNVKFESLRTKCIKRLRELRSLSVRDVGDLLDVSFTTVSHMENGRAVVHEEYLKKFLKALKFTNEDYEILLKGKPTNEHLKLKCYRLIDGMELSKLEKACGMLSLLSLAFVVIYSFQI